MSVDINGLADNGVGCDNCDEQNLTFVCTYYDVADVACRWDYCTGDCADVTDENYDVYVSVAVSFNGTDYISTAKVSFASGPGGCTFQPQFVSFTKNLGSTKPSCPSGLTGSYTLSATSSPSGNSCSGPNTDPNCGCLVAGVTCDVS